LRVTEVAESDLGEAVPYIRNVLRNPQAALRLLDEFEKAVQGIAWQPTFRPLVQDGRLARIGYRWVPVGGYMAFFTIEEESHTVYIERLLFGRSDWRAIL